MTMRSPLRAINSNPNSPAKSPAFKRHAGDHVTRFEKLELAETKVSKLEAANRALEGGKWGLQTLVEAKQAQCEAQTLATRALEEELIFIKQELEVDFTS